MADTSDPRFNHLKRFLFNAWYLFLLWVIGGIYIPKEYFGKKLSLIGLKRRRKPNQFPLNEEIGQVAVLTGGSRGIGYMVAKELLSRGLYVFIGSSGDKTKRNDLKMQLCAEVGTANVEVHYLDLKSMKSVQSFAHKFQEKKLPLHLLINNAGIMFEPFELTIDNFESHLSVNYLGHCLLSQLFLPSFQSRGIGKARIINVTSCVAAVGKINFEDLQGRHCYSPYFAYMQSKVALLMFSYALEKYLSSEGLTVQVYSVHPGVVDTGLHSHVWWAPRSLVKLYRSSEEGASCIVQACFDPALEQKGGSYIEGGTEVTTLSKYSLDEGVQDRLWIETWKLLKLWLPTKD